MEFDYMAIWNSRDILIRGVLNTLLISAVAISAGIVLGIIICFMRISSIRALRWTAIAYIEIIRNIPLLILIFMLFYALPFYGVRLSGLATGFLCLSMYGGAYFAEIFRGGIESVSKGQFDACKALGLKVYDPDISEISICGGGVHCMCQPLRRDSYQGGVA